MKLISCYHPKVIKNKYSGDIVVARCGKCPACLNARSASWVQRLDNEAMQHRYTFFATLQFDEQHVKQLVLLDPSDRPSKFPSYIDIDSSLIIDLSEVPDVSLADIQYCEDTKYLLVHDPKIFQDFIKRLRKIAYEKYNARLRYFIALEYGPTTYRPHGHSLFFFDSELLAKDFEELLSACWKHGCVYGTHPVAGSASSYVASYVNSFASLPKIYLHQDIRQKALFSKCPPIGSFTWSDDDYKRFFDTSVSELTLFKQKSEQFINVPFWRFISCRLYPRIVAFDRLSHYDRITLYRLGLRFIETSDCFGYPSVSERRRVSESNLMYFANFLHRELWFCYEDCFKTKSPLHNCKFHQLNQRSLERFISAVSIVARNCLRWNVSIADYVTKIESFYESLEKKQFADYLRMQDDYFKSHETKDFLAFNPNFCLSVANKLPSQLELWQRFYISIYNPNLLAFDKPIFIKYSDTSAYKSLRGIHDKIYFDNTKQKKSNDYLLAHKDKFYNIITYNQEINNYVTCETF